MKREAYESCKEVVLQTLKLTCHVAEPDETLSVIEKAESLLSEENISTATISLGELGYQVKMLRFDGTVNDVRAALATFEKDLAQETCESD